MKQFTVFIFAIFYTLIVYSGQAILISETVAIVQNEILSSRDMSLSSVVENLLNKKSHRQLQNKDEKIQAVNTLLLDRMVDFEAQTLGFKDFAKDEADRLTLNVEKTVSAEAYLKQLQYKKDELQKMVERKLIVKSFLKSKSESFISLLSDQDIQVYYDKNRIRFGTVPIADLKENIRAFLMQQQREDRLKLWIEVLKKKYKARNYLIENQKHSEGKPIRE